MYAGITSVLWSVAPLEYLDFVNRLVFTFLGLPPDTATVALAGLVTVTGAGAWWVTVERGERLSYRFGGLAVVATALWSPCTPSCSSRR